MYRLWRRRVVTPRFTRAIYAFLTGSSEGREHVADARRVRRVHQRGLAQAPLPLARLLGQDVLLVAARARDLAAPGPLEPLRGPAVRLHLRHVYPSLFDGAAAAAAAASARAAAACAFFSARTISATTSRFGTRIIERKRPSMRAGFSTTAMVPSICVTRSIWRRPSSRCASSRPRNMTVIFPLSPWMRNRLTLLSLVSRSWSSVRGRSFTSLSDAVCPRPFAVFFFCSYLYRP